MKQQADIGLIGLAVMGQNLVLNMNDHGYTVAVYNRTTSKTEAFLHGPAEGRDGIIGTESIEDLVGTLKVPRKVMLMVRAGDVVDHFIEQVVPHLQKGDVLIDGGNSHFPDTVRRAEMLEKQGILFIGTGVSGGEEGARKGPSLMPGGNPEAWPLLKDLFQDIAAKTDSGEPCCDWVGASGAGHYVKMVHNGIEYADMQLIAEAYNFMKTGLGLTDEESAGIFTRWNSGELDSYLIEITAEILRKKDTDGSPLVGKILDAAGQKGTGKWTGINALELGTPVTVIAEAVFARSLSALKEERENASTVLPGPENPFTGDKEEMLADLEKALLASKIAAYAQGYMLMREAAAQYGWDLNYGGIALMWRGGCIIRSVFLGRIKEAFDQNPDLYNLLTAPYFADIMKTCQNSWRRVTAAAAMAGIPMPAFFSSISFYDGYRSAVLPANLIQAQRDYFGAHTYERTDRERGTFFHTDWTGEGSGTASGTYTA